ncbi:MAG TPA: hypothetical protein VE669_05720, partial [Actinomycetota bacterium]|nr:hypothetical protein [Actinomycetota bacterium]
MDGWIIALIVLAALAIVVGGWYAAKKRREAFAAFGASHGLEYTRNDPYNIVTLPFQLFGKGDGRKVENVLAGPWRDVPMKA